MTLIRQVNMNNYIWLGWWSAWYHLKWTLSTGHLRTTLHKMIGVEIDANSICRLMRVLITRITESEWTLRGCVPVMSNEQHSTHQFGWPWCNIKKVSTWNFNGKQQCCTWSPSQHACISESNTKLKSKSTHQVCKQDTDDSKAHLVTSYGFVHRCDTSQV